MAGWSVWFSAFVIAVATAFCAQMRCESDSRIADLERRIAAAAIRDADAATARRTSDETEQPPRWWCHAGRGTCFRDPNECARKHAQGAAGCEPRRIAYCAGTDCSGDLAVCRMDERTGKFTRFCIGVE